MPEQGHGRQRNRHSPVAAVGPTISLMVGCPNIHGDCCRHSRCRSAAESGGVKPSLLPAAATAAADDASLATDGTSSKLPFAAECITTDNRLRMVRVLPAAEAATLVCQHQCQRTPNCPEAGTACFLLYSIHTASPLARQGA